MSRYNILRELGRGGMGVVYLAEDTELGRQVAMKFLHPALSSDDEFVKRFRQEAQFVAGIVHPHIVHINNIARWEHRLAIDMEYVEGESLQQHMARDFVTPATALRIVREILHGLSACHSRGLVHCDIKPGNVLLNEHGSVKIADFGLARAYSACLEMAGGSRTTSGILYGTPAYTPPELWDGAKPTPASDLYSVGIVLYELLAGTVPHHGPTPLAIVRSILTEPLEPLSSRIPHLSVELSNLVEQLLSVEQRERPKSAEAVLEAISILPEYVVDTDETPTVGIFKPAKIYTQKRISWNVWAYAGAVIVLLIAGLCAIFLSEGPDSPDTVEDSAASGGYTELSSEVVEDESPSSERLHQADLLAAGDLSAEALLSAWKHPAAERWHVYEATALDHDFPGFNYWLVLLDGGGTFQQVVGYSRTGLLSIENISESKKDFVLEGGWADYRNPSGTRYREGTVSASGHQVAGDDGITFLLDFTDVTDNSNWSSTVTARPDDSARTDTRFLYDLQVSDAVLPLLYNELIPRRVPWALELEPDLSCMLDARLRAPFLSETAEPTIDGRLDEPLWQSRYLSADGFRLGTIPARPKGTDAELEVRADNSTIYMGVRLTPNESKDFRLALAVVPMLEIPASQSPTYVVHIDSRGQIYESALWQGTRERAWTCDWTVGVRRDDGQTTFELAVPNFAAGSDSYVRLNAAVTSGRGNSRQTVYQWGFPDTEDALHGILVSFEKPYDVAPSP